MSDSLFEKIQAAAEYLRLELDAQEMATIATNLSLGEAGISAVAAVLDYLRDKKKEQIVSTLLRMSRLPLREPKTFENFDFVRAFQIWILTSYRALKRTSAETIRPLRTG